MYMNEEENVFKAVSNVLAFESADIIQQLKSWFESLGKEIIARQVVNKKMVELLKLLIFFKQR